MDGCLDKTYAAIVFDWDGTAVTDRRSSTRLLRARLERLSRLGVHLAVVSGTHVDNVDGQLRARPQGPGELLLALNRGSELFQVTDSGPRLLGRRVETPEIGRVLDQAAEHIAATLRGRGLHVQIVSHRINRRKIDLIPEPAWADPPKSEIADLLDAVEARVRDAGFASLAEVVALATEVAADCGLGDPRVTSDAKHLEVGVTDKSDSMRTVMSRLADRGVGGELVLVAGDEFGTLGGAPGSDSFLRVPDAAGATVVSVGSEPAGVPTGILHLGGGPTAFLRLLDAQLERARRLRVPDVCRDPGWTVVERGVDVARHRVSESLFTLTSGGVGLRGPVEESPGFGQPLVVASGVYAGGTPSDGLLPGPDVLDVRLDPAVEDDVRVLDLRTGVLVRDEVTRAGPAVRSLRFGSLVEPGLFAVRIEAARRRLRPPGPSPGGSWSVVEQGQGGIGAGHAANGPPRPDDGVRRTADRHR